MSATCDHTALPLERRVSTYCPKCRDAGIADYLVVGPGWRCSSCGWANVTKEVGDAHEQLSSHQAALDALGRRATHEREIARLLAQIGAAKTELAGVLAQIPVAVAEQGAQVRAATRDARAELASLRERARAARNEATETLRAARSKAAETVGAAREEANSLRAEIAVLRNQVAEARTPTPTLLPLPADTVRTALGRVSVKRIFPRRQTHLNRQTRTRCEVCGVRVARWNLARHRRTARCRSASST